MRGFENFTNDSAMMIAWERHLETERPEALFQDPLAKALAGTKGQSLSDSFGEKMCTMFELEGWPEFHKTWTVVRTRFIDDHVAQSARTGSFQQLVNLGAGMDTRAYRLDCYKVFTNGVFGVDMEVVNNGRKEIFNKFLNNPTPHCPLEDINLNFLDEDKTLATELGKQESRFDVGKPSIFVAEGQVQAHQGCFSGGCSRIRLHTSILGRLGERGGEVQSVCIGQCPQCARGYRIPHGARMGKP